MTAQTTKEYLTADELAARWQNKVTTGTLANWRSKKTRRGPPFVKFGAAVLYPIDKLTEWERANLNGVSHE